MGRSQNKRKTSQPSTAAARVTRKPAQRPDHARGTAAAVQHAEEQLPESSSGVGVAHLDGTDASAAHPRRSKRTANANAPENQPSPVTPNDPESDVPLCAPPKKRARKEDENKVSPDKPGRAPMTQAPDVSETSMGHEGHSAQKRSLRPRQVPAHVIPRSAYEDSSGDEHVDKGDAPQRLSLRIPPLRSATRPAGDHAASSKQGTVMIPGSDSDSSSDTGPTSSSGSSDLDSDSHRKDPGDDVEDLLVQDSHRLSEIINAEPLPRGHHDSMGKSAPQQVPARLRHMLHQDIHYDDAGPRTQSTAKGKLGRRQQAFEIEKPYFRTPSGPESAAVTVVTPVRSRAQQSSRSESTNVPAREVLHVANRSRPLTADRPRTRSGAAAQQYQRATSAHLAEVDDDAESSYDDADPHSGDGRAWSAVPDPVVSAASGEILLKKQGKAVQEIIDYVNEQVKYHVSFIDGFPDTGMKGTLSKKLLRKQAKKLGYDDIAGRLAADADYANKLARVPDNRISHLRTQVKKACASQVVSQYGLRPGDGGRVQRWLDRRFYIFPGDVDKRLEKNLPYEHPIFVEVIASCFFRGSDSIASKWASRFKSSDPGRPDEVEVPQAMVALVATAVHNALMEWRSGAYRALAFHGAVFEEQYRSHLEILEGIKARSLRTYHAMMHRLFTAAWSSTDSTVRASENDPDATINVIDFDDAAPDA
ncbi:hypothetical protein NUW54_g632 [Trametes sanguinea]|uniref:Uncharacterized protein n=1 Tax=Trametes sanguinea TaxID=158606 RepID=A0ACC1Q8M6_9APHY|nr:hypothetical protein NUW54_g632 [Trametes sanguinea]